MVLKTAIVGWYGKNNIGDESYKLSFPKLMPNRVLCFSDSKPSGQFDHVILGGGDIVAPSFLAHVKELDCPKHLMSVTVPRNADLETLKMFETMAIRDKEVANRLQAAGLPARYVPDFAFALEPNAENGDALWRQMFAREGCELYQNRIVITLNSHLMAKLGDPFRKHQMFEHLMSELAYSIDNFNASFMFLPFGSSMPWDDRVLGGIVQSRCKFWRKNLAVFNRVSVQEALDIYAAATAAVSTRLHSTIFSTICNTPFLDITHNHKNTAFLASAGLEKYGMAYWSFSSPYFNTALDNLLKVQGEVRSILKVVADRERAVLANFKADVLDLQQKPRSHSRF